MNQIKIGKFISTIRKENNLTQEQLGLKLGITKNAVSKWERGLSLMDISLLEPLSEILGVSIEEILNGERNINETNSNTSSTLTLNQGLFIYVSSIVWVFLLGLTRLQGIAAHCIWISLISIFGLFGIDSISKHIKHRHLARASLFCILLTTLSNRLYKYFDLVLFSMGDLSFLLISCLILIIFSLKFIKQDSDNSTILSLLFFINGLLTLSTSYTVSPMTIIHTFLIIIGSIMYAVGIYLSSNSDALQNNKFITSLILYFVIRFLLDNGLYSLQLIILETLSFTILFIIIKHNKTDNMFMYSIPLYLTMFRLIFGNIDHPIYLLPLVGMYFTIITIPILCISKFKMCQNS